MAVTIIQPTAQVVNRQGGVTIAWTSTYPQIAYEILYRRKGVTAWSTFNRVTSTSQQAILDTSKLNDFEEYHFRVVVYTDYQANEANRYAGSDTSAAYSIILVPNSVSIWKAQGANNEMIEVPIYPSSEDVGSPHVGIGGKGNVPLVDVDDPIATKLHTRVNGETKAMAGATAKTEPTNVNPETDIDVTVTQYAYNTQAHNYYYAYTAYYYYLNSSAATGYKQYYNTNYGANYTSYTTGPSYSLSSKYTSGTYYPTYTYYTSNAYYDSYTAYYYYGTTSYAYYSGYYEYLNWDYINIKPGGSGYGILLEYYYRYYFYSYKQYYGTYSYTSYTKSSQTKYYLVGYYRSTKYAYYAKTYYYTTYYYTASYGTAYYISSYYRYYSYGGYTSYSYTAYNYALSSQTKYSGYTTYTYYRYIPGYYKYKITA